MACYHPRRVALDRDGSVIWKSRSWTDPNRSRWVNIPCGKCLGCDRAVQRDWSLRIYHEVSFRIADWRDSETGVTTRLPEACVVTLTYDDDHLPLAGALDHRDYQRFMKRLRRHRDREAARRRLPPPSEVKYFMCGEYGPKTRRPHFHAVLLGIVFDDCYSILSNGRSQRCSYTLDRLWSAPPMRDPESPPSRIGVATVDSFSFGGAMYVTGYVAKKAVDKLLGPVRDQVDPATGECREVPIQPEYRKMSRGEGLGSRWIAGHPPLRLPPRFHEVYSEDCVTVGQWTFRPPRHYDRLLRRYRPDLLGEVLRRREEGMFEAASEWTESRCSAAELVALASLRDQRSSF